MFVSVHRVVQLAEKYQPKFNPKLSKLSMAIFQQQNKGSFLERMERDALKKVDHSSTTSNPPSQPVRGHCKTGLLADSWMVCCCCAMVGCLSVTHQERLADKLRLMREAADRACTFKPEITKKSAELQSRTPVEMSRGDLLRKETNARLLRLRFEKERYSDFTFQ